MACALDVSRMRSDLNKLNKDILIDIIVNGSIPDRISVSDNMRKYIKNQFEENSDEYYDATSSDLKISNEIDQLKCNLKISIVERNALQRLVKELENDTKNQEMLIDSLKENGKSTTVELDEPNHNVATPQGPVTVPGRKSVIGHNKEAGRVSPMKNHQAPNSLYSLFALTGEKIIAAESKISFLEGRLAERTSLQKASSSAPSSKATSNPPVPPVLSYASAAGVSPAPQSIVPPKTPSINTSADHQLQLI
ncbi:hypothetical protein WA026_019824 [Henosepilachna vigintioctopunctata]|uniref:Uncharacterized protein n=1 Tax=Henosepilachna vigintioctopunctata TaxID=420089 RepID=A0AAW1VGZ4_9CUCU